MWQTDRITIAIRRYALLCIARRAVKNKHDDDDDDDDGEQIKVLAYCKLQLGLHKMFERSQAL